jgi:hypothetical protein
MWSTVPCSPQTAVYFLHPWSIYQVDVDTFLLDVFGDLPSCDTTSVDPLEASSTNGFPAISAQATHGICPGAAAALS